MKNLTEYNAFTEIKRGTTDKIVEAAQMFDDVWKVRTSVEIPNSLLNAYKKKVLSETGRETKVSLSEQELVEEITKYVSTAFLTIENLPTSIVVPTSSTPQVQGDDMPVDAQVQGQVQPEVKIEEAPMGQEVQGQGQVQPAQEIAQEVPQSQGSQI